MKNEFISFTDIKQFRNIIRDVQLSAQYLGVDENDVALFDRTRPAPTITFNGTVKLHGTNAGVAFNSTHDMWVQSRKNIITPEKDNAGFAFFVNTNASVFQSFDLNMRLTNPELVDKTIVYFGEWCGGSIQKGVAINGLDKMFVIFAVKIVDETDKENNYYLKEGVFRHLSDKNANIYNSNDFARYQINIDFENPGFAQEHMREFVELVEAECPVGNAFGKQGIGEGIVWIGWDDDKRYVFKTKGEKHSSSKVKTVAKVDIEKLASINEFVEYVVTSNRLNQAIEQVFTVNDETADVKKTGDFIRWVVKDVMKEELDTMAGNGLEPKEVNGSISKKTQRWFMNYLDEQAGL